MGRKKAARKAPQKQCPKCGAMVHARKSACDCGHQFTAAAKKRAAPAKKKAVKAKPKANSFADALVAERDALKQRLDKIDELLDTYQ
jgi:hypothetical protein